MSELSAQILAAAVGAIDGTPRPGQQVMAEAIESAIEDQTHLLVQAGTGTGKSLGYLAPLMTAVTQRNHRVVIATATLALQTQLATKDVPLAIAATEQVSGRSPRAAVVKGWSNYACLLRSREEVGASDALIGLDDVPGATSEAGRQVVMLREWVEQQLEDGELADRDDAPPHSWQAWNQVSVSSRECVGAANCPYGDQCFVKASRERARDADVVITNHALLAIHGMTGRLILPEHDVVVIDEAHELPARITSAASVELSPRMLENAIRRAFNFLDDDLAVEALNLSDDLTEALDDVALAQVTSADSPVVLVAARIRGVMRRVVTAVTADEEPSPEVLQVRGVVEEIFDIAERVAKLSDADVVWVSESEARGRMLHVAPLAVAATIRDKILAETPTVCTSATLELGGSFEPFARSVGLREHERLTRPEQEPDSEYAWRTLDVGSPFDYPKQGILYVASELPKPSRDGLNERALEEIAQLVWAAGGRTLGLFSSKRAAETAAAYVRAELPSLPILTQWDGHLPDLQRQFIAEPHVSLFGTLSLWQGIDVPGDTCQLVLIDKIPFPRPDDPLMQARQVAVAKAGGNGFMSVAATHAALLLAQGAGRLIRRSTDRGVVAILDPRLRTERYGSFLRRSLPPLWATTSREITCDALRRLTQNT